MIDINRIKMAHSKIYIEGLPKNQIRRDKIEQAIKLIQENPTSAMLKEYLGVKQYAGFDDQECDCRYGMGPTHGNIVFSIGRKDSYRGENNPLGEDEIYFLLTALNNPKGFGEYTIDLYRKNVRSLSKFIQEMINLELKLLLFNKIINESNEGEVNQ